MAGEKLYCFCTVIIIATTATTTISSATTATTITKSSITSPRLTRAHDCDQPIGAQHHHNHQQQIHKKLIRSPRDRLSLVEEAALLAVDQTGLSAPLTAVRDGMSEAETVKVAALATKLDHWLQCSRMNLLLARQQQAQQSFAVSPTNHFQATGDNNKQEPARSAGDDQKQNQHQDDRQPQHHDQQEPITCPPHFDGHLCWPQAQVGQQIQLLCPKIDYPLTKQEEERQQQHYYQQQQSPSQKLDNQQQAQQPSALPQPLESSLSGPTGGDLNQSQEIALANLQSITPTGSRAGIGAIAAMNQPPQDIRQDGISRATAITTTLSTSTATRNENTQTNQERGFRYATRRCERSNDSQSGDSAQAQAQHLHASMRIDVGGPALSRSSNGDSLGGQWQSEADYSACRSPAAAPPVDATATNNWFDPTDQWVKLDDNNPADAWLFWNLTEQLERVEISIDPYSERALLEQWTYCIGEVMRRQQHQLHGQQSNPPGFCPIIFDGWRCWPATRAGEIAYVNCPSNQPGFSAERKAYKICTLEGDWYRHPETNRYWSNYTTCVDTVDLAFRTKILNLYVIGNLISLIALTASLVIFVSFKSLKCTRVTIHKNLFLSFITNNLMWIIWYTYVVNDADLLRSNPVACRVWHILLHYFLVSNYFWMFCEGLYLHTILVVAFVSEDKILKWFYLLGWLTPIPIIITYAYNRSHDPYHTNFCWMEESPHNLILMAPIGISLLLNLVFLINIVRVLVTKLRANNSPDTHQTRKAVRATLILIPLLGLHYMLMPFRPEAKSEWEMIYEIIAAVCTSFQGLCVAMLFCFCNGEVINVIKKKLKDTFLFNGDGKRAMRSRSNTTISNVLNNGGGGYHNGNHLHARMSFASPATVVSAPGGNGNLLVAHQRQPLMNDYGKQNEFALTMSQNSGQVSSECSLRSSLMTTTTNVSPVLQQLQKPQQQQHQHQLHPTKARPMTDEIGLEETVRLLEQAETNNNNSAKNNHRSQATA